MSKLPKPQPCGQRWLDMQPTANGRLCGQCDKEIFDFSGMAWPAIVRTHAEHGNALCGMYTTNQLKHWGQTPLPGACAKLAAATTLAFALSAIPATAQTTGSRIVSGTVVLVSNQAKPEPVPFATVMLAGTQVSTLTDEKGHYELTLPADKALPEAPRVQFMSLGMATTEWPLPPSGDGPLQHDVVMERDPNVLIMGFSVRQPTLPERAKWSLKRWFSRRK